MGQNYQFGSIDPPPIWEPFLYIIFALAKQKGVLSYFPNIKFMGETKFQYTTSDMRFMKLVFCLHLSYVTRKCMQSGCEQGTRQSMFEIQFFFIS